MCVSFPFSSHHNYKLVILHLSCVCFGCTLYNQRNEWASVLLCVTLGSTGTPRLLFTLEPVLSEGVPAVERAAMVKLSGSSLSLIFDSFIRLSSFFLAMFSTCFLLADVWRRRSEELERERWCWWWCWWWWKRWVQTVPIYAHFHVVHVTMEMKKVGRKKASNFSFILFFLQRM